VRLAPPPRPGPAATDVASALREAADRFGHRPAVTVLGPDRRDEQGFASLAQWAAKGAHLLTLDLLAEPRDTLRVDLRPGWPLAAVTLAAWWSGLTVSLDDGPATVAVVEEGRPPGTADEVLWIGDAVDGAPLGEVDGEAWVHAVQTFPDQPPAPAAAPELAAIQHHGRAWSQRELLQHGIEDLPGDGPLGIDAATSLSPPALLAAIAVRPLSTGRPTVVLRGTDRTAAAGERVAVWR
jgi:hypothetical protein